VTLTISHYDGFFKLVEVADCGRFTLLLFTKYKTTCLTIVSIHCLAESPAKDVWGKQSHLEKRIKYRNLKRTFEDSLPCYCYKTKNNSRTMLLQISQPESADGVDMNELQDHYCITPRQWCWFLCSVSAIPVNKLLLQELNQLIEIKMLTSDFLNTFGS